MHAGPAHLDERRTLAAPLRTILTLLALTAALTILPSVAKASTALDPTFGSGGSVFWGLDGTPQPSAPFLTSRDGQRIYAVGSTYRFDLDTFTGVATVRVVALTNQGKTAEFGTDGTLQIPLMEGEQVADALELPDGTLSILVGDASNGTARLLQINAAGTTHHFTDLGLDEGDWYTDGLLRSTGQPMILAVNREDGTYHAYAYDQAGAPTAQRPLTAITDPAGMTRGDRDTIIVASRHEEGLAVAIDLDEHLNTAGVFGASGQATGPESGTVERLLGSDGIATYWDTNRDDARFIERWSNDHADPAWTAYPSPYRAPSLLVYPGDGVLLAGVDKGRAELVRLQHDGTPDPGYGTAGTFHVPTGVIPPNYEVSGLLRPFALGAAVYVTGSIGSQTSSRSLGSSTGFGYISLWRVGEAAAPVTEPTVDDRQFDPSPTLSGAAAVTDTRTTITVPGRASNLPTIRAQRCVSRRAFTIRLRKGPGNKHLAIRHVTLTVAGERVAVSDRARRRGVVNLTGLPKGRFTVRAEMRLQDGQRVIDTRKYRTCALKKTSRQNSGSTPDPVKVTR